MRAKSDGERDRRHGKGEAERLHEVVLRQTKRLEIGNCRNDEKAGLTKRTLYYHFRSKDDLIAAYLETRDQPNLALFQRRFAETEGNTADKVSAIWQRLRGIPSGRGAASCGRRSSSSTCRDIRRSSRAARIRSGSRTGSASC